MASSSDEETGGTAPSDDPGSSEESGGMVASNIRMFKRNPQLMKVLFLAGFQQGNCNLAATFVFSNLRVQYWGEQMSEYQSIASILISAVAVIFGGPFGRFSDAVDRRVAVGLFAAGTFLPGWALQIFGETASGLWLSTVAQIIGSFGLTSNVLFTLATDVTNSADRELMAGAYFAFLCLMNVICISIPVLLIMVLKVIPNNMELIICVQTLGSVIFFLVLCTVKAEKVKEEHHDNEMWFAENGGSENGDVTESEPPARQDFRNGIKGLLRGLVQPFFLAFGHRRLRRLCLCAFLLAFGGNLVSDIGGQFFNQSLGLFEHPDPSKVVMVSVYSMLPGQIMAIPGNIITGYIAKQAGPLKLLKTLIPFASLLIAAGALMAVVRQMWYIAVVVICLTYANMPNVPLQRMVAGGVAPPGRNGEALATVGVFTTLAGLIGNMVVATINPWLLKSGLANPLWVYYPGCAFLVLLAILPLLGTPRGGWGSATGKLDDQIMAISWADGALQRWYYFALRQRSLRLADGHTLKSFVNDHDGTAFTENDAFLPEAAKADYAAAFALFDHSGTGQITKSDIGQVLKAAGHFPTPEEIEKFIGGVDVDGDGMLSKEEFIKMVARHPKDRDFSAELIEAFKILDENADGYLSMEELEKGAKIFHRNLTREDLKKMMEEADSSRDDRVSFPEFERIMKWGLAQKFKTIRSEDSS